MKNACLQIKQNKIYNRPILHFNDFFWRPSFFSVIGADHKEH